VGRDASPVPEDLGGQLAQGKADPVTEPKPGRTGRNLPAAAAIGVVLGGLVLLTLFTVKATFLAYVGVIVAVGLWELRQVLAERGISLPLIPIAAGGAAMFTLAYWYGAQPALAATAGTVLVLMAWRLPGGANGYLRDLTASIFTLAYLPMLGVFVPLMLSMPDGARRTFIFVLLAVCSDVGGYFAGIFTGRHPMAPGISPKKTWEGLGGSVVACLAAGAITLPWLLRAHVWQGLVLGAAAVAAATLGDLVESMIKRDLEIKDMGRVFPGHGGAMDRLDSLVFVAPVAWLLLTVFVPHAH
jgi:phosphatidate cytidylyltransferase